MKLPIRILLVLAALSSACSAPRSLESTSKGILIQQADALLVIEPVTITHFPAPRSAGQRHDYYSEGPYWWPNPEDPNGPYIRRDGEKYPGLFTAHHDALNALRQAVTTLTIAYTLTREDKYALHALKHLHAWFVHPDTRMHPSLLYAQAIKGIVTGRGIGIIDTVGLIEVARSIQLLEQSGFPDTKSIAAIKQWFSQYVDWMTTHQYGIDERDNGNNHSSWWIAQVAAYSQLCGKQDLLDMARQQFKKQLAGQMDTTGAFPEELARTKPFGYMLYNLDALSIGARLASTPEDNLWIFQSPKGSLEKAWRYMLPYIQDKSTWPFKTDIESFDRIPYQSAGLLLAAKAYHQPDWLEVWKNLHPKQRAESKDINDLKLRILWE